MSHINEDSEDAVVFLAENAGDGNHLDGGGTGDNDVRQQRVLGAGYESFADFAQDSLCLVFLHSRRGKETINDAKSLSKRYRAGSRNIGPMRPREPNGTNVVFLGGNVKSSGVGMQQFYSGHLREGEAGRAGDFGLEALRQ